MHRRLKESDPTLDEETLADTVEGLTDLHEIVAAIMRSALIDEALVDGLKLRIGDMEARLERLQDRASKRRAIARDVMTDTGITKITLPDFTISIRPGTPSLVVTNEAEIPGRFFEPREPKLNRQALLADLKQGAQIAGAALSNPQPVLSVRTK
jgi:hypothetical protein